MAVTGMEPVSTADLKMACDSLNATFNDIYDSIEGVLISLQAQIDQLKEEASKPVLLWTGNAYRATVTGRLSDYSTLTIYGTCSGEYSGTITAEVGGAYVDYSKRVYATITSTGTSFTVEVECTKGGAAPACYMTSIAGSK